MSMLQIYTGRALDRLRATRVRPLRLLNWAGWVVVVAALIRSVRRER
jgi:hypothetical protein